MLTAADPRENVPPREVISGENFEPFRLLGVRPRIDLWSQGVSGGQKEVMGVLLEGRSALAVFPTGAGKSLCYQPPALMLPGLTLVISPLIALMREQVKTLRARGVAAVRLDSTLEVSEVREIYEAMDRGELKLIYVVPERMANEGFLGKLRRTRLSMIAPR